MTAPIGLPEAAWLEANYQESVRPKSPEELEANYQAQLKAERASTPKSGEQLSKEQGEFFGGFARRAREQLPSMVKAPLDLVFGEPTPEERNNPIARAYQESKLGRMAPAPVPEGVPMTAPVDPLSIAAALSQRQAPQTLPEAVNAQPVTPETPPSYNERLASFGKGLIPRPDISLPAVAAATTPGARGEAAFQALNDVLIPLGLVEGGVRGAAGIREALADRAAGRAQAGAEAAAPVPRETPALQPTVPTSAGVPGALPEPMQGPGIPMPPIGGAPAPVPTAGPDVLGPGIPMPPIGGLEPPMLGPGIPMPPAGGPTPPGPVLGPPIPQPPIPEPIARLAPPPEPPALPPGNPDALRIADALAQQAAASGNGAGGPASALAPASGISSLLAQLEAQRQTAAVAHIPDGLAAFGNPTDVQGPHLPPEEPRVKPPEELTPVPAKLAKMPDDQLLQAYVDRVSYLNSLDVHQWTREDINAVGMPGEAKGIVRSGTIGGSRVTQAQAMLAKLQAELDRRGVPTDLIDQALARREQLEAAAAAPPKGPLLDPWEESPEPTWRPPAATGRELTPEQLAPPGAGDAWEPGAGPERIAEAALLDHDTGQMFTGPTHAHAAMKAGAAGLDLDRAENDLEEGFTTTRRPFVDRTEAAQVAKASGQIAPQFRADANEFGDSTELGAEWLRAPDARINPASRLAEQGETDAGAALDAATEQAMGHAQAARLAQDLLRAGVDAKGKPLKIADARRLQEEFFNARQTLQGTLEEVESGLGPEARAQIERQLPTLAEEAPEAAKPEGAVGAALRGRAAPAAEPSPGSRVVQIDDEMDRIAARYRQLQEEHLKAHGEYATSGPTADLLRQQEKLEDEREGIIKAAGPSARTFREMQDELNTLYAQLERQRGKARAPIQARIDAVGAEWEARLATGSTPGAEGTHGAPAPEARAGGGQAAEQPGDLFGQGGIRGAKKNPRPDEGSLFAGPQENLLGEGATMRESDVGRRVEGAPQGITAALEKARRTVADPREQYLNKVGQPTPHYLEAEALLKRAEAIGPEELQRRAADLQAPGAGTPRTEEGQGTLFGQGGIRRERPAPEAVPRPREPAGPIAGPRLERTGSAADAAYPDAPGVLARRPSAGPVGVVEAAQRIWHPEGLGTEAKGTAGTIREQAAEGFRSFRQAQTALAGMSKMVGALTKAESVELWDAAEHWTQRKGVREVAARVHPQMPALIDALHGYIDAVGRQLEAEGILHPTIQDYLGRFWSKQPVGVMERVRQTVFGKRPLEGGKSFAKERTYATFREGLEAGETPLTYNFVDAQLLKLEEMHKALAGRRMVKAEEEAGRARMMPVDYSPPKGWGPIGDDPAFTVYGPPIRVGIGEAYDADVREGLTNVIKSLSGLKHKRMVQLDEGGPGWWGYARPTGKEMATKFGGENMVIAHELGHILDFRYKLWDRLHDLDQVEGTSKTQRIAGRVVIDNELRALADKRLSEGSSGTYRRYVRNKYEKMANAIDALTRAPALMDQVAPNVKAQLTRFFQSVPELRPLLDIKPGMRLGSDEAAVEPPNQGIRIIGRYVAPQQSLAVWHNFLSKGLAGNPLYDALMAPGRAATQLILGVSGFHATVIGTEAVFSELARGLEKAREGDLAGALKSPIAAATAPVTGVRLGQKVRDEYLRPGSYPELTDIVNKAVQGGYRYTAQSELYGADRMARFKAALQDALRGETAGTRAWGAARVPLDALYAAVEKLSDPVLGRYVPLQKAAATAMRVADEMGRLPPEADLDAIHERVGDVVKEMDYRFGQVVYDNHFVHNAAKHLAQLTFLAPGWTFGTLALAERGAADVGRAGLDLARGRAPQFGKSGAYWLGAFAGTALMNGILTYAMTGEQPEGKDFLAFRDGSKDADGNWNRHTIPGYIMKDLYGWSHRPVHTATAKLSPALHWAYTVLSNEDYWGDKVYDPTADWPTIVKQIAAYSGKTLGTPLSIRNYLEAKQRGEKGPGEMIRNAVGVNPAPREFVRTPAQNLEAELRQHGPSGRTPDEVDAGQRALAVRRAIGRGELNPEQVRDSVKAGALTVRQALNDRKMARRSEAPWVAGFAGMPWERAERVYDAASPEEQAQLAPFMLRKRERQLHERRAAGLNDATTEQLLQQVRAARDSIRTARAAP